VSIVSYAADRISDAAADIAQIVLRDIGIHPVVREVFERVEEHLCRTQVSDDSILVGRKLRELEFASRIGVDIIAIHRGKDWIINPKDSESIFGGDILIARGTPDGVNDLKQLAQGTLRVLED
jgi:uncharacterized protein with PhoU and TrkA domain